MASKIWPPIRPMPKATMSKRNQVPPVASKLVRTCGFFNNSSIIRTVIGASLEDLLLALLFFDNLCVSGGIEVLDDPRDDMVL